jgi:hypothetical protein
MNYKDIKQLKSTYYHKFTMKSSNFDISRSIVLICCNLHNLRNLDRYNNNILVIICILVYQNTFLKKAK